VKLQTLQAIQREAERADLDGAALIRIIRFESGGRPDAKNASGATGLIQWMPDVFRQMGKPPGYENVRHDDLPELTAEEQIPLVLEYLREKGVPSNADVGTLYLAVAAPAFLGRPDATIVYSKGSTAWQQNKAWRPADDGSITVGSIKACAARF
jgi:hypothetical protein